MVTKTILADDLPASPACGRILAALPPQGGMAREELSRAAYVGMNTLSGGGYLLRLRAQGLIHGSGWRRSSSGAFSIPQFSVGAGPDYPWPTINPTNRAAAILARFAPADIHGRTRRKCPSSHRVESQGQVACLSPAQAGRVSHQFCRATASFQEITAGE